MSKVIDTTKSRDQDRYAQIGNATYVASLVNTIAYCAAVVFFKDSTIFDKTWSIDGFCIANKEVPFWSSHDLCLYADVVLAGLFSVVYYFLHKEKGMEAANDLVFYNIFGVIAHGFGHGGLGAALRDTEVSANMEDDISYFSTVHTKESWVAVVQELFFSKFVIFLFFWVFLLKAAMRQTPLNGIFGLSILSYLGSLFTAPSFGFTYTQTILLIAFCVNQLLRPVEDKGFAYYIYGLFVSLPLGVVGWLESTMCSSTVIHMGGHLIYDAYIPLSMLAFYLCCYNNRGLEVPKTKVA